MSKHRPKHKIMYKIYKKNMASIKFYWKIIDKIVDTVSAILIPNMILLIYMETINNRFLFKITLIDYLYKFIVIEN